MPQELLAGIEGEREGKRNEKEEREERRSERKNREAGEREKVRKRCIYISLLSKHLATLT